MLVEIGVIKRRLKELGVPRHLVEKHIERVTRGDRRIERSRAAADQLVNGYLKMPSPDLIIRVRCRKFRVVFSVPYAILSALLANRRKNHGYEI